MAKKESAEKAVRDKGIESVKANGPTATVDDRT
jgi:uncharacterized protein YegP (UPF0339 family)